MKYLYSRKNVVGSGLALIGLLLVLAHVIGPFWPLIVIGLYLVGAVLTPGKPAVDLQMGFDPNDIRKTLDNQMRTVSGRVPPEVMAKLLSIRQIIVGILPRSGTLPPGSPELFLVERTATDYLPTALQAYLNLPQAYATLHPVQNGKTPKQVLLDQLTLLEGKMNEVADDVHRNDSDRLLANGRFLEERFGRSSLSLEPPASGQG
ncbi:MAG: hypothetical protein M3Z11_04595 [Candidatus Dormibacteraeota bacterium]|nr:hypothetical protein [Candidatus Dormibacteraeota bacterium]